MTVTLFVVGDSPRDEALVNVIEEWTALSFVTPSLWIKLAGQETAVGDLTCTEVTEGGAAEQPLLLALAKQSVSDLGLVVVRLTGGRGGRGGGSLSFASDVEWFLAELKATLPVGARPPLTNLIVPVNAASVLSRAVIESVDYAVSNVVVSPEDRPGDTYVNPGIRTSEGGNEITHAALAAATAAGLWAGMTPPKATDPFPSVAGEHLAVMRAKAAAILVPDVVDAVCETALAPRSEWPVPDGEHVNGPIPALDPSEIANQALETCGELGNRAFQYKAPERRQAPPRQPVGILSAFGHMFGFIWQRLKRAPLGLRNAVRDKTLEVAERLAQSMTYGDDSTFEVGFGGRRRGRSVESSTADARRVLDLLDGPHQNYAPPTPQLWSDLRRLVLALADGSEIPAPFTEPVAGDRRQIVNRPRFLSPSPFESTLAAAQSAVDSVLGSGAFRLSPADALTSRLALEAIQQAIPDDPDNGENTTAEPTPVATTPDREPRELLERFIERCRSALLWRLGERVSIEIGKAQRDLSEALATLRKPIEDVDLAELKAAWRRCWLGWLITTIIAGIIAWRVSVAYLSTSSSIYSWAVIAVVWLLFITLSFARYLRLEFQMVHRAAQDRHARLEALDRVLQAARELVRLSSLYSQLTSWTDILGFVLHLPFGAGRRIESEAVDVRTIPSPAAFRIGTGALPQERLAGLAAGASREVYQRGWLTRAYEDLAKTVGSELATRSGLADAPDPDLDTPQAMNGARDALQSAVRVSSYGDVSFLRARSRVSQFCRTRPPEAVAGIVRYLDPTGEMRTQPAQSFLGDLEPEPGHPNLLMSEIWQEQAQVSGLNEVATCTVWSPAERREGDSFVRSPIEPAETPDGTLVMLAIRSDLSAPCTSHDLKIFRRPQDPATPPRGTTAPPTEDPDGD